MADQWIHYPFGDHDRTLFYDTEHSENFGMIILINTAIVTPYMYAVAFRGLTQPTLWQIRHEATAEKVEAAIKEVESIEASNDDDEPRSRKQHWAVKKSTTSLSG
jgi:hypothetical protein